MGRCCLQTCTTGIKNPHKIHKPHLYSCPGKGGYTDTTFTMEKRCPLFGTCLTCLQENQKSKKEIHISCHFLIFNLNHLMGWDPQGPSGFCNSLHSQLSFTHRRNHIESLPFLPRFWPAVVLKGILSCNFIEKRRAGDELCKPLLQ